MGWNRVEFLKPHPVFQGLPEEAEYYFVHSYYPEPAEEGMVLGVTEHGIRFPSAMGWRNLVATQFHPGKERPLRAENPGELPGLGRFHVE